MQDYDKDEIIAALMEVRDQIKEIREKLFKRATVNNNDNTAFEDMYKSKLTKEELEALLSIDYKHSEKEAADEDNSTDEIAGLKKELDKLREQNELEHAELRRDSQAMREIMIEIIKKAR